MRTTITEWVTARRVHAVLSVVWLVLSVPSMIWWRNSISYLVFVSVYAIVVSHWSAWQGAKAETAARSDT